MLQGWPWGAPFAAAVLTLRLAAATTTSMTVVVAAARIPVGATTRTATVGAASGGGPVGDAAMGVDAITGVARGEKDQVGGGVRCRS